MPTRIIRPGILSSDRVDALSAEAEVFYRRLMSVADDYGRFEADWRVLRAELYPLRADRITKSEIEAWLAECARILEGEDEPLVLLYQIRRKKYLQINNFGQRVRAESKYPGPPEELRERNSGSDSAVICGQPRTSAARASTPTPSPSPHTPSHSNSENRARAKDGSNGVQTRLIQALRAAGFDCRREFQMPDVEMGNGACIGLRADVAVMGGDAPVFLIECKDFAKREKGALRWELTVQYRKYAACGVPFALCNGVEQIESVVELVRESLNGLAEPPAPDSGTRFEELVQAYPPAGRERLQQAYWVFTAVIAEESKQRRLDQSAVLREMLDGILRWKASERWQAGKIHLLKTFLAERLWREEPVRAGPPKRQDKHAEAMRIFDERMREELHAKNHHA